MVWTDERLGKARRAVTKTVLDRLADEYPDDYRRMYEDAACRQPDATRKHRKAVALLRDMHPDRHAELLRAELLAHPALRATVNRWPLAPLIARLNMIERFDVDPATGKPSHSQVANRLGISFTRLGAWKRDGLSEIEIERYVVERLRIHPTELWTDYHAGAPTAAELDAYETAAG